MRAALTLTLVLTLAGPAAAQPPAPPPLDACAVPVIQQSLDRLAAAVADTRASLEAHRSNTGRAWMVVMAGGGVAGVVAMVVQAYRAGQRNPTVSR